MKRTVRATCYRTLFWLVLLSIPQPSWAAGKTSCLGDFRWIAEGLPRQSSERVLRAFKSYNPAAQKGVVAILAAQPAVDIFDPDTLAGILDQFPRGVMLDANPLGTDEALFEVIGELTEQETDGILRMREGLPDTIRALSGDFENAAKGAAFDLYMAKKVGYGRARSFQKRIDAPGTSRFRQADLLEDCPGYCGDLPGIHHENKNFGVEVVADPTELANPPIIDGVFKYTDGRLTQLGDEFARDILIHRGTSFDFYRLNFRMNPTGSPAQIQIITDVLSKQFDSPLVKSTIQSEDARELLRQEFLARVGSILNFHP